MNNAGGMCSNESGSDLDPDVEYFYQLEPLMHVMPECKAIDKLSRDIGNIILAPDLVNGKNVWVVEGRCGLCFLDETFYAALVSGKVAGQEFQSDVPAQFGVLG